MFPTLIRPSARRRPAGLEGTAPPVASMPTALGLYVPAPPPPLSASGGPSWAGHVDAILLERSGGDHQTHRRGPPARPMSDLPQATDAAPQRILRRSPDGGLRSEASTAGDACAALVRRPASSAAPTVREPNGRSAIDDEISPSRRAAYCSASKAPADACALSSPAKPPSAPLAGAVAPVLEDAPSAATGHRFCGAVLHAGRPLYRAASRQPPIRRPLRAQTWPLGTAGLPFTPQPSVPRWCCIAHSESSGTGRPATPPRVRSPPSFAPARTCSAANTPPLSPPPPPLPLGWAQRAWLRVKVLCMRILAFLRLDWLCT